MPKRALVVDDEEIIRDIVANILGDIDVHTDLAEDLSSALSFFERTRNYDAVFTDLLMNDGNGIDFAKKLRDGGYRGRIVLATGTPDATNEIAKIAGEYGITYEQLTTQYVNAVLTKPFRMEQLLDALQLR